MWRRVEGKGPYALITKSGYSGSPLFFFARLLALLGLPAIVLKDAAVLLFDLHAAKKHI